MTNNKSPSIYWLASYPKSGNTWTRVFIANLTNEKEAEQDSVDINELNTGAIASARGWVEGALGFDINELSHDEIDWLRPTAYRYLSEHNDVIGRHKVHDAYDYVDKHKEQPLFPDTATKGVLYIVRNPLDVAISFAHHNGQTIDRTVTKMANRKATMCGSNKHFATQLRQKLFSWSEHVKSWLDCPIENKLIVRYEDMKLNPEPTFTRVARFLELPDDQVSIVQALAQCSIEKLQDQEATKGFSEKSASAKSFFRKGIVGDWQQTLTSEQVSQIINDHREVMMRLGYLDKNDAPVLVPEVSIDAINS